MPRAHTQGLRRPWLGPMSVAPNPGLLGRSRSRPVEACGLGRGGRSTIKRRVLQAFVAGLGAWGLPGAVSVLMLAASPAAGAEFLIEIRGSPALQFRGDCVVVNEAGDNGGAKFRGLIPKSYVVDGAAVSCSIQKWDAFGRLKVKLFMDDELIARADTAAAFNWVTVRSAGPWGRPAAVRGANPLFSIRRGPRSGIVPPFSTSPVPSLKPGR